MNKIKIILSTIFLSILIPLEIAASSLPPLHSSKMVIYDVEEKEVLYEIDANQRVSIASLTKIVTTLVAIENIDDLEKNVTITYDMLKEVPYDASIAHLKVGDVVTYEDLLYASILPSGADATISLAKSISGSTEKFVELMNEKVESLGLSNTHFVNVTGYDDKEHFSTLNEILIFLNHALENPLFKKIYCTKNYTLTNGLKVESTLNMYNKFLNADVNRILGSKTGFTNNAGVCISALVESNGRDLIIITLGAKHDYRKAYNLEDTLALIDFMDKNYKDEVLFEIGDLVEVLPVVNSKVEKYEVKTGKRITKYIDISSKDDIKAVYEGKNSLEFKDKKGDKIGTIKYFYRSELIDTEDVFLERSLPLSIVKVIKTHNKTIVLGVFILSILFVILVRLKNIKKKSYRRRKK